MTVELFLAVNDAEDVAWSGEDAETAAAELSGFVKVWKLNIDVPVPVVPPPEEIHLTLGGS